MSDRGILVLGQEHDPHIPLVQCHLDQPLVAVNPSSKDGSITIAASARGDLRVFYKGALIDPDDIKSVWYRGGNVGKLWPDLHFSLPVPADETRADLEKRVKHEMELRTYAYSALQHLADGLMAVLPPAFWASSPQAMRSAGCKPPQLLSAQKFGFNVPEWVMTSDADEAEAFLRRRGQAVLKPLANCGPERHEQYTQLVTAGSLDFSGLIAQPQILQRAVLPEFEVRVSVIGLQAFAAKVGDRDAHQAIKSGVRDYRLAFNTGSFQVEPFELPADVADLCVRFVQSQGTPCGFIDLIYSGGRYWFLENNPNGQWGFKDDVSVELIGRALAELLAKGAV